MREYVYYLLSDKKLYAAFVYLKKVKFVVNPYVIFNRIKKDNRVRTHKLKDLKQKAFRSVQHDKLILRD